MEVPKGKRQVVGRSNWKKEETELFLQMVIRVKEKFEKSTAHIFYEKIAKDSALNCFSWKAMRDKMRNMKNKYKMALAWRNNTGAGLDDENKERTIREYILKICPQFDQLDELFGERHSITPLLVLDTDETETSSDSNEVWMDVDAMPVGVEDVIYDLSPSSPPPTPNEGTPRTSPPPDSLSLMKQKMAAKPKTTPRLTSSLAQLNQISQERMDALKYKADKDAVAEERRLELEREKFLWQQTKEKRMLEMKQEELNNKFLLEKLRIEKEFELELRKLDFDNKQN